MRKSATFLTLTAIVMTIYAASTPLGMRGAAAAPEGSGGIRMPLVATSRDCNFGFHVDNFWGRRPSGYGEVLIRRSGNSVTAEVHFVNTRDLGAHYDVGLIQTPQPPQYPCDPGTPGTAWVGMVVDPAGRASATVQSSVRPGATGAWVNIQRSSPRSQLPEEHYSTSYLANI